MVGSSPDHHELLLSNKPRGRKGSHSVLIDDKLLAVLQEAVYGQRDNGNGDTQEMESGYVSRSQPTAVEPPAVAPREIQRRLRAGMTVAQVARSTGADEDYVEQFNAPVVYEREGVIRDAGALSIEKSRLGVSGLALGDAVEQNLAQRRVRMTDDELARAWSATRQDNQPWLVTFTFPFRGRARKASWRFDQRARELVAANKQGLDLGWVPESAAQRRASRGLGTSLGVKRKPARRKTAAKRKSAGKRKAAPKRKAAKRKAATRRKASARTAARKKPAARRTSSRRPAAKRKTAKRKTAKRKTAKRKTARRR